MSAVIPYVTSHNFLKIPKRLRYQTFSRFLHEVLKVSPAVAEKDACMIEHVISSEMIGQMAGWLDEKNQSSLGAAF